MSIFLLGHATTPDKLKISLSAAGDVDTQVSYIDYSDANPPVVQEMKPEYHTITGSGLTDICAGVADATQRRSVKNVSIVNVHASVAQNIFVVIDAIDGNDYQITETITLQPGESYKYEEGVGWFKAANPLAAVQGATNKLTGGDQTLSTTDVYLGNSALTLAALGAPTIGRCYHWRFIISKTAGTAAPVLSVRVGTAGSTADTARVTFTWGVGTSVADRAEIEIDVMFVAVGASAVLRGKANMTNNLTTSLTGFTGTTPILALQPADSGTFDSTVAASLIGLSWNGSTAFAGLIEDLRAYTDQL